jgi:hypothetical protein
MRLPLEVVFKRGAIFLWKTYARLDDPEFAGKTKPKFIVVLSASPLDDPILFILTTSEKAKHAKHPMPKDLLHLPAGVYDFLTVDTLIDAGEAGQLEVGREEFVALYQGDTLICKGSLNNQHAQELMSKIAASRRVSGRVKQMLTGG